jgi:glycosyltransferase involved in cell wall biosynthesis
MRILHINLERGWYGGESQTLYLMEGLRALGHENTLLARDNDIFIQRVRAKGFPVQVINKPFLVHGRRISHYDLVQTHEKRALQLAVLWKYFHKSPIVYTRRLDYIPGKHVLNSFIYSNVDCLVAISEKIRSIMTDWGYAKERIRVIPDSVSLDIKDFPEDSMRLRQRFQGKKVIGCVASLVRHKDHDTLIEAAAIIRRHRDDVVFILVGDGVLREALELKVRKLGLENIVFEGYQHNPYPYYGIFDVFTMTSREEGLGSSILEAYLYRVPVVATTAGGIPDIVKDHETGLLVPVENPHMLAQGLLRMLDDEDLRLHCAQKAYASLEQRFTIETMSRSYESLYHVLADRGSVCV